MVIRVGSVQGSMTGAVAVAGALPALAVRTGGGVAVREIGLGVERATFPICGGGGSTTGDSRTICRTLVYVKTAAPAEAAKPIITATNIAQVGIRITITP